MTASVGRIVSATFSSIVRYFARLPHPQPKQPECQQAAQLGAALGGGHLVGRERIGSFHVLVAVIGGAVTDQKPPGRPGRDISEERNAEMRTGREHQGLPITDMSMIIVG